MNVKQGIRRYGAKKFAKVEIFGVLEQNPQIWPDQREIWHGIRASVPSAVQM